MENLAQGLIRELNRNRELLQEYKEIGPAGAFGAKMIEGDIAAGEKAQGDGDVVAMVRVFETLKNNS